MKIAIMPLGKTISVKRERIVVSMIDYIFSIHCLTTNEFCSLFQIPPPRFTGEVESSAALFLQVEAIKASKFIAYAKFLSKDLTREMFIGTNAIFNGFEMVDSVLKDHKVLTYKGHEIISNGKSFWLFNSNNSFDNTELKKIEDLIGLDIEYNNKNFNI